MFCAELFSMAFDGCNQWTMRRERRCSCCARTMRSFLHDAKRKEPVPVVEWHLSP